MDIYELSEFERIRTVYHERHDRGGYSIDEFDSKSLELCTRGSEYYLLYWFDPLPGGVGDNRCEGIVHISAVEAETDDSHLLNLYYNTKKKYLISMSQRQERMTLTYLNASYSACGICFAYCASARDSSAHAGCIEFTKDEMQMITEKRLKALLRKAAPKGTVIPSFRLYHQ